MNWPSRHWLTESDVDFALPQSHLDRLQHAQAVDAVFMANSLQQGMLHHSLALATPIGCIAWLHAGIITVRSGETFKRAWQWVQQQFSCLRLRFDWRGEIVQVVDHEGRFPWRVHDISHLSPEEREHALHRLQESEQQASFDLQQSGLYRVCWSNWRMITSLACSVYITRSSMVGAVRCWWGRCMTLTAFLTDVSRRTDRISLLQCSATFNGIAIGTRISGAIT